MLKYQRSNNPPTFAARMLDYLAQSTSPATKEWRRQVALWIVRHQGELLETEGEEVARAR